MPAIELFERRTLWGGDDLHVWAVLTATIRFVQLLGYILVGWQLIRDSQTTGGLYSYLFMGTNERYLFDYWNSSADDDNTWDFWTSFHSNHHRQTTTTTTRIMNLTSLSEDCRQTKVFPLLETAYVVVGMLLCLHTFWLTARLYYWSSQGSPTQREPRSRKVQSLLEIQLLPFTVIHALVWMDGIAAACHAPNYFYCLNFQLNTNDDDDIDDDIMYNTMMSYNASFFLQQEEQIQRSNKHVLWWLCMASLLLSQIIEILGNLVFLFHLFQQGTSAPDHDHAPPELRMSTDSSTRTDTMLLSTTTPMSRQSSAHERGVLSFSPSRSHHDHHQDHHELVERMWESRCSTLCRFLGRFSCFIFGGKELFDDAVSSNGVYRDVARALADYLETGGVLDVVPSDLITGFLLLQRLQAKRLAKQRQWVVEELMLHQHSKDRVERTNSHSSLTRPQGLSLSASAVISPQTKTPAPKHVRRHRHTSSLPTMGFKFEALEHNSSLQQALEEHLQQQPSHHPSKQQLQHNTFIWDSANEQIWQKHEQQFRQQSSLPVEADNLLQTSPRPQPNPFLFSSDASFSTAAPRQVINPFNKRDLHRLRIGARCARYALAIYTWGLYLYVHPITGVPRLLTKSGSCCFSCCCCCCCCGETSPSTVANTELPFHHQPTYETTLGRRIPGDTICQTHKSALLLTANLDHDSDLVYVQLNSSFKDNPYCILLDHDSKAVVVSIRGTFSLEDCVTDVLLEPESLEPVGDEFGFDGTNQYVHGGVLAVARNVYRDLERHGLLDYYLASKYPTYELFLVGHSLGAACATLLSFMMQNKYPNLRCFSFSPPGSTITWDLAVQSREWCTSYVLDNELVPRLSFESLERLRDQVLELIGRIKVNKVEVARRVAASAGAAFMSSSYSAHRHRSNSDGHLSTSNHSSSTTSTPGLGGILRPDTTTSTEHIVSDELLEDLLHTVPPESEYHRQLKLFKRIQSERRFTRGVVRSVKLFPPGRMLHLIKTGEEKTFCGNVLKILTCCMTNVGSQYTPMWIDNADLQEIVVGPTMGTDHFPNRMLTELENICNQFDNGF